MNLELMTPLARLSPVSNAINVSSTLLVVMQSDKFIISSLNFLVPIYVCMYVYMFVGMLKYLGVNVYM